MELKNWQVGTLLVAALEKEGVSLSNLLHALEDEGLIKNLAALLKPDPLLLEQPFHELNLSIRATGVIAEAFGGHDRPITIGMVTQLTAQNLKSIRNCGHFTLREIRQVLAKVGLKLLGD